MLKFFKNFFNTSTDNIDEEKNESMKAKQKQLEKKEKLRRR